MLYFSLSRGETIPRVKEGGPLPAAEAVLAVDLAVIHSSAQFQVMAEACRDAILSSRKDGMGGLLGAYLYRGEPPVLTLGEPATGNLKVVIDLGAITTDEAYLLITEMINLIAAHLAYWWPQSGEGHLPPPRPDWATLTVEVDSAAGKVTLEGSLDPGTGTLLQVEAQLREAGTASLLASQNTPTLPVVFGGLAHGNYEIRLRLANEGGLSDWSEWQPVSIQAPRWPADFTAWAVFHGSSSIKPVNYAGNAPGWLDNVTDHVVDLDIEFAFETSPTGVEQDIFTSGQYNNVFRVTITETGNIEVHDRSAAYTSTGSLITDDAIADGNPHFVEIKLRDSTDTHEIIVDGIPRSFSGTLPRCWPAFSYSRIGMRYGMKDEDAYFTGKIGPLKITELTGNKETLHMVPTLDRVVVGADSVEIDYAKRATFQAVDVTYTDEGVPSS